MKNSIAASSVMVLLFGVAACSVGGDEKKQASSSSACKELFGKDGISWLEGRLGKGVPRFKSFDSLSNARSLIHAQLRGWNPKKSDPYQPYLGSEVCEVRKDIRNIDKSIEVRYGPSIIPFGEISARGDMDEVSLGSGAKIIYGFEGRGLGDRDGLDVAAYRVYFKCKISNAHAEQEEKIPIEGETTDTLTGDRDARTHLRYLLHSAQVMARTLDCQNKPVIPDEPPASVK